MSNSEDDYQQGSYTDDFQYMAPPSSAASNNFNNWFWEIYPQISMPVDEWVSFQYRIPANDKKNPKALCSQVTIKGNVPNVGDNGLDAEIFNNANIQGKKSKSSMQPPSNTPFPNGRLKNVLVPYKMTDSLADEGALYLSNKFDKPGTKNTPYYPSSTVPYSIKMRIKTDGCTFGTRGWGFWNTIMLPAKPIYCAWFWEFGVQWDLSDNLDNSQLPLVIPIVMTMASDGIRISVLIKEDDFVNFYQWNDYQIIWSENQVHYYVDDQLVAVHDVAPPIGSAGGGMAYHCWVDNRLFYEKPEPGFKYIGLPVDKTNSMQQFEARPHKEPIPSGTPTYQTYPITLADVDFREIVSKVKEIYLKVKGVEGKS